MPRRSCWSPPIRWPGWRRSGGPCGTCRPGRRDAAASRRQAAEALAAWRAGRFELPDYYLSLTPATAEGTGPDLYLGPLRAARPRRVAAVLTAADDGQAAGQVRQALRELPHGPWWPPLDELLAAARTFFAGSLGGSGVATAGGAAPGCRRASAARQCRRTLDAAPG